MSLVFCAVISFLTSTAPPMVSASDVAPHVATLTQEVRYKSPEVGEVLLVWGIDGWNPLPESLRPLGTTVDKSVMHTPMNKQGEWFVVTIRVPSDSTVDFGFKITKSLGGSDLNIWDGNGKEGYRAVAKGHDTIEVISHVSLSTSGRWSIQDASSSWGYLVAAGERHPVHHCDRCDRTLTSSADDRKTRSSPVFLSPRTSGKEGGTSAP